MEKKDKASFLPCIYGSTAKLSNKSLIKSSHPYLRKLEVEPVDSEQMLLAQLA
jgi:hypothetical protein